MKSDLQRLTSRSGVPDFAKSNGFIWATGIEDTFLPEPHPKTGRILDEYSLSEHYSRWKEDLGLMPELQVSAARYGLPWYKLSPSHGNWDWSFADGAIDALTAYGIEPIVDLVHYGTPEWMEGSFLNPDYPSYVAEYASEFASRYKGRVRWYTPFNEPRISAYYSGKLGIWPPHGRGWKGFVSVLTQICKGIVLSDKALKAVDPEIVHCHVDATDIYEPTDQNAVEVAAERQEIVFLALDLLTGRFKGADHPLYGWAIRHGLSPSDLEWFQANRCTPDVLGINLYPLFSLKSVKRTGNRVSMRMPYAAGREIVERLGHSYWERYRIPLMVTETASAGSVERRAKWLNESVAACRKLRSQGVPMIGYTWWPMFSLVAWAYLGSHRDISNYLVRMGLWDLDADLNRVPTRLVDLFAQHSQARFEPVGTRESSYVS
jgi:beta-glucosidase